MSNIVAAIVGGYKVYTRHLDKETPERPFAIEDMSISVEEGTSHAIIGMNGSGKSTLLKSIMGLISLTKGSASLMGTDCHDPVSRRHVGYLPEVFHPSEGLSVESLLTWQARFYGLSRKDALANAKKWIIKLDIQRLSSKSVRSLSKGQRQRVGLGMSLVHDPKLIILDEPMSGLDPVGRWEFSCIINELRKAGKTVIICSHLLDDVEKFADKVHIIHQGKNIKCINVSDIRRDDSEETLESIFLKTIKISR